MAQDIPVICLTAFAVDATLATGQRTLGLMGVWGRDLREPDVAPFRVFASQVAHIMERAMLYEAEIRRSVELERANGLCSHSQTWRPGWRPLQIGPRCMPPWEPN